MPRSPETSSNQPDPEEVFGVDYDEDPNCVGYALCMLGIIPVEGFVSPASKAVRIFLNEGFDIVAEPKVADLLVITSRITLPTVSPEAGKDLRMLVHMAVVDKQEPLYATDRRATGEPIRRTLISDIMQEVQAASVVFMPLEFRYVRLKDNDSLSI